MGAITRAAANNFTTSGVILPAAINNTTVASISDLENVSTGGGFNLIKEVTASSSASVSLVHGTSGVTFDGTYPAYMIELINVHPADDRVDFTMNFTSDGTNFNVSKTTTVIEVYSWENDSTPVLGYRGNLDLGNSTGEQSLAIGCGNDNDECISSKIYIFRGSRFMF